MTKIDFPRLLISTSAVVGGPVDLAISIVMLLVIMTWYGIASGASFILVPPLPLGVGTLFSALTRRRN